MKNTQRGIIDQVQKLTTEGNTEKNNTFRFNNEHVNKHLVNGHCLVLGYLSVDQVMAITNKTSILPFYIKFAFKRNFLQF